MELYPSGITEYRKLLKSYQKYAEKKEMRFIVNKPELRRIYLNLGRLYLKNRFYENAAAYCEKAMDIDRDPRKESKTVMGKNCISAAKIYEGCSDNEKAAEYYKKAEKLFEGNDHRLLICYSGECRVYDKADKPSEAIGAFTEYIKARDRICKADGSIDSMRKLLESCLSFCRFAIEKDSAKHASLMSAQADLIALSYRLKCVSSEDYAFYGRYTKAICDIYIQLNDRYVLIKMANKYC